MYIYIYIYIYTHACIYIYIYIYVLLSNPKFTMHGHGSRACWARLCVRLYNYIRNPSG